MLDVEKFETAPCPVCDSHQRASLLSAQDDLTGKPGTFHFVSCTDCGHSYQNPRLKIDFIGDYYDENYVSHKKESEWGFFGKLTTWAFGKHDRDKFSLVSRFVKLTDKSQVLDIGCARGTFLQEIFKNTKAKTTGVDFKDLPEDDLKKNISFHKGLLKEAPLQDKSFDLITMWHYLEHCYEPAASLQICRRALKDDGRLIIEVPCLDSVSYRLFGSRWPGVQAPQHTSLFSQKSLHEMVEKAGFKIEKKMTYGAFPRFFYYYTGFVFHFTKGRGIVLQKHVVPYFLSSLIFYPFIKQIGRAHV